MTDLYSDFLQAGKLVAKILKVQNAQFKSQKYETPKVGVDYVSDFFAENLRFNFHLRTESKESDFNKWASLSLSLYFYNNYDLCQFHRHKEFKHPYEQQDIMQWASEVAKDYVNRKSSNDLDFLFGDQDIRVRGLAGITNATLIEFIINLKGYLDWGADRLLVYRFHHGTGRSEGFSYAFLIESRHLVFDYSFWCVFPTFVGMSGGTGYGGYKQVESLLEETKKKIDVEITDIRVDENAFLEFLGKRNVSFAGVEKPLGAEKELEELSRLFEGFGEEVEKRVSKGPSKTTKYSLSKIPGEFEKRVFIGGNYDNISVLREIETIVSDLGYQPILALEFDVPPDKTHDYDMVLLHNCKRSIFEVTVPDGHMMELERAEEYGVETLVLFQARDESRKPPPTISGMVLSLHLPKRGYCSFKDLRKIVGEFLRK